MSKDLDKSQLSERLFVQRVEHNLDSFNEIYNEKGDEVNPIPDNTNVIVYCENHNSFTRGWTEISKLEDLGLEALIAKSWITKDELMKLPL